MKRGNGDGDGVDIVNLSDLPEHMIHSIMSLLSGKDAIHTSVLSKHFLSIWRSFPILDFDYQLFSANLLDDPPHLMIRFFNSIAASIRRRPPPGSPTFYGLESLRLRFPRSEVFSCRNNSGNRFLSELLSYAIENFVKHLTVNCTHIEENYYSMPQRVYGVRVQPDLPVDVFSAKAKSIKTMNLCGLVLVCDQEGLITINCPSLEDLTLERCNSTATATRMVISCPKLKTIKFEDCKYFKTIQVLDDKLESFSFELSSEQNRRYDCQIDLRSCKYSLKALKLKNIQVRDEWFSDQVSGLVSLEALELKHCRGLHTIISTCNNNLERVELINCEAVEYIEVVSRKLKYFHYLSRDGESKNHIPLLKLHLYRCPNLKDVLLEGANITDEWFRDHFNPVCGLWNLEKIFLKSCNSLQIVEIDGSSSGSNHERLKSVDMIDCNKLFGVKIDTPNLEWFNYNGPILSKVMVTSTKLEAQIYVYGGLSFYYHQKMRNFLSYFGICKTLTLLCFHEECLLFSKEAREVLFSPLCDLKHLNIKLMWETELVKIVPLIEWLLWLAPCLDTICIATNAVEPLFLLELYRIDEMEEDDKAIVSPQCCVKYPFRCWRHSLTRVEVADNFKGNEERARLLKSYFLENANVTITTISTPRHFL